ncbi:MAG: glycosyltransferase family 2 protein [Deltaproteobacteria bacterium]|nr:glycosyltransferase family 2 protein [Deltaproteobacteria bacterium]
MIQDEPLISVVVPTRNRAKTLKYCLETIVTQSYRNMQIVVSDNFSSDNTKEVVAAFNDPRITYVRAERPLSMNENYSFALQPVKGDYVTYIGDDDGFLPDAIQYGMNLLQNKKYAALTWRKIDYVWPDHKVPERRNIILGQSDPLLLEVNGMRKLKLFAAFKEGYNKLPCIYNSIIKMSVIERVRAENQDGIFFGGVIPDVYSGIALSPFIGDYLQAFFPLTVNGASSMSSGVMQGLKERTKEEEELIKDITPAALKSAYHADMGSSTSVVSIAFGEFLTARSRIKSVKWPRPRWRLYVKRLIREALQSFNQEAILASARYTVGRRKLFMRVPRPKLGLTPAIYTQPGYFLGQMCLPLNLVSNVKHVADVVGSLMPKAPVKGRGVASYLLSRWFQFSFRTAVEYYRYLRS